MFERYTQKLRTLESSAQLTQLLDALSISAGFTQYRMALRLPTQHLGKPDLLIYSNCDPDWIDRYKEEKMASQDPILYLAMQQNAPIVWSKLSDFSILPHDAEFIMTEAKKYGLCNGISFPLRGPHGEFGVFSFITDDPNQDNIERHSAHLSLIVNHVLDTALRISYRKIRKQFVPLSNRELECLFWAAEGKTSAEIAIILNFAECTANFHLKSAIGKLGASNRTHAIIIACMAGLIQPLLSKAEIEDEISSAAKFHYND